MADTKISGLASGSALVDTDVLPVVETTGVGPVKKTALQIKAYILDGVKSFGAKGDAKKVTDGNSTGGSNTITSATAAFVSTDVGKMIWAVISDGTLLFSGRTITTVNSATSVTVSGAAFTGWTNLFVVWGTDDTAAIQAAGVAALANNNRIFFSAGGYIVSSMLFDFRFGVLKDAPNIEGEGANFTTIYINPSFDFSSVPAGQSAILAATGVYRQNMTGFTVDGTRATVSATGLSALAVHGSSGIIRDVWVLGMHGYTAGIQVQATQTFLQKCHVEDCGYIGIDTIGGSTTFFECYSGNCGAFSVMIENINGESNTGIYARWVGGIMDESIVSAAYVQNSTDVSFIGAKMFGGVGAYAMIVDGASKVRVTNSEILPFGTGNRGGLQVLSGGTCNLGQTRIAGSGTMDAINNAGTLINAGGNTLSGTVTGTGLGSVV